MIVSWSRSRYPLHALQLPRDEASVQAGILALLARRGIVAVALDVGGARMRGRAAAIMRAAGVSDAARRIKGRSGEGIAAGWPDIVGVIPPTGRLLAIECKRPEQVERHGEGWRQVRPAGSPSAEQVAMLARLEECGAVVCVAWDESDVERMLDGEAK